MDFHWGFLIKYAADGSGPTAILMQFWKKKTMVADCSDCASVFSPSFLWNVHRHGWYFSSHAVAAVTSSCLSQHIPTPWELSTYTIWTSNVGLSRTVSVSQANLLFCLLLLHFILFATVLSNALSNLSSFFLSEKWFNIKQYLVISQYVLQLS